MVKVLLTGATGTIGGAVLEQCLAHPDISTVVAFARRELPDKVTSDPKLQVEITKDFSIWPEELLNTHRDATAMIWTMGDYVGSEDVTLQYPLAFQNAFIKIRTQSSPGRNSRLFMFILGLHETRAIDLAERHKPWFNLYIVRPGGVLRDKGWAASLQELAMGRSWSVRARELSAYMVYLALGGDEADTVIMNEQIVEKGRELVGLHAWA
uniref:NAD(P)-binding domain-containing protein n=1 Tax=Bionectria ochroleuca TaxID=29856 RepID=A0A8H7K4Q5_BIOOC